MNTNNKELHKLNDDLMRVLERVDRLSSPIHELMNGTRNCEIRPEVLQLLLAVEIKLAELEPTFNQLEKYEL